MRHLFAGPYKALVVDESDDFYLRTVCDYVHLNPVRAGILERENPLESFLWSSHPAYLRSPRKRHGWLRVDRLLGEHGIRRDDSRGRREFLRRMETRRAEGEDEELIKSIRRGWRFGAEYFLERLGDRMKPASSEKHAAEQVHDQHRKGSGQALSPPALDGPTSATGSSSMAPPLSGSEPGLRGLRTSGHLPFGGRVTPAQRLSCFWMAALTAEAFRIRNRPIARTRAETTGPCQR